MRKVIQERRFRVMNISNPKSKIITYIAVSYIHITSHMSQHCHISILITSHITQNISYLTYQNGHIKTCITISRISKCTSSEFSYHNLRVITSITMSHISYHTSRHIAYDNLHVENPKSQKHTSHIVPYKQYLTKHNSHIVTRVTTSQKPKHASQCLIANHTSQYLTHHTVHHNISPIQNIHHNISHITTHMS